MVPSRKFKHPVGVANHIASLVGQLVMLTPNLFFLQESAVDFQEIEEALVLIKVSQAFFDSTQRDRILFFSI